MRIIIEQEGRLKKKLALIWVALNLCSPRGTIEIHDVMKAIEKIVGNRRVMHEWKYYLKDEKIGVDWLKRHLAD